MNENDLNHTYTPAPLADINAKLLAVFSDGSEQWFTSFSQLITQRDAIIREHLAALDEDDRKVFADAELKVNERITEVAQKLLDSAKGDVTHFVRSQAAIKKYK